MPTITKISKQRKKADWCSIFIDGKYSFSLPISDAADLKLKIELELSPAKLTELKSKSTNQKLYEAVIQKLSRRQHSEFEIRDFLYRKQADEDLIEQIIEKLVSRNYLDDFAFAEMWARNRRQIKSSSTRQIRNELYKKRIDSKIIDEVLSEKEDVDREALKIMIAKKSKMTRYKDEKKLISYLLGKGFNYNDIKSELSSQSD
jgi:regulatory protein